jgi:membrane protein insertase Oxa1/YidC/SpoIIIJ
MQAATTIPWFPFIIMCGFGVRLLLAPLMVRQMVLINKMGQASPNIRLVMKLYKHSKMSFLSRLRLTTAAIFDYAKQTNTNLLAFYFYNLIQIPVFIVMVLSIRKISYENDDLAGAGILWFKNLNEADPYMILPIVATLLNYINLGVSFNF